VKPSTIDINIDTLVLEGAAFARGVDVAQALRAALTTALLQPANAALVNALRDRGQLECDEVSLSRADSAALGEAISAALVCALRAPAPRQPGAPAR
jgi:hypothetical protein